MPRKRHVGKWEGRILIGSTVDPETGKRKQQFEWVGRFDTKRERDDAVAERKRELAAAKPDLPLVEDEVVAYLEWHGEHFPKSLPQKTEQLKRFRADFGDRAVDIPRDEIKDWAAARGKWAKDADGEPRKPIPNGYLFAVSSFYTFVIDEQDRPIDKNPARKLAKQTVGRSDTPPPTPEEFDVLLDATAALGDYAPTIRAMFEFAAFTLMRPSELYALKWEHIDFNRNRIDKCERVYRGKVADPKTGAKEIALTPPAKAAILNLNRTSEYVFPSITGKRMSAGGFSGYWARVLARAELDFDFYLASKHYGVWYMHTVLEMPDRVIAAQAGWKRSTVTKMIETYGHGEVGALEDVDAAFANVAPKLRVVGGSGAAR
ncbi:MAG: tyrosine-type recombinase/integrase [Actinobacteria bacterium]|nr:tyrosine-type recombinase/integrase [Actinomycetota bacterium]